MWPELQMKVTDWYPIGSRRRRDSPRQRWRDELRNEAGTVLYGQEWQKTEKNGAP